MKTLLVLATHPDFAEAVRTSVGSTQYRVVSRATVEEAEPLLAHGIANLCIIDLELTSVKGAWLLDRLRRIASNVPLIVFTGAKQSEWEEEAYLHGAAQVLNKPVRPRLLNNLLERLHSTSSTVPAAPATPSSQPLLFPASALPPANPSFERPPWLPSAQSPA